MLNREGLFTQQTPENIDAISTRCTLERTNRKLIPALIEAVRKIDFRYVEIVRNTEGLSASLPLNLIDIQIRALKRLSGRMAFMGPFEVIRSDIVERYLQGAPAVARLVSLFSGMGERLLASRRRTSEAAGIEHDLLRTMANAMDEEQLKTVDGKLLEELISIAEERGW